MDEVLAIATGLSRSVGLLAPIAAERLSGGKNNRVFRIRDEAGNARVLKLYHSSASDTRDRLGAEWRFISYARQRNIESVPQPLAMSRAQNAALYSLCEGHKLEPGGVLSLHVAAALDFIVALNRPPRLLHGIEPGSEACFSLADHVATVAQRVRRLGGLDQAAPHGAEAATFVAERLFPAWSRLEGALLSEAGDSAAVPLAIEARIVSPSDFGFHNSLAAGEAVSFIDFEYAGMDDPAKLVGDFFSVPEIPTPVATLNFFIEGLQEELALGPEFGRRARRLLDAYRIKWACIILNDFLPQGDARRAFALEGERAERCRMQLDKAAGILDVACSS
jgi:hypothetical protein